MSFLSFFIFEGSFFLFEFNILPMCIIVDLRVVYLSPHWLHLIVIASLVICLPLIFIFGDQKLLDLWYYDFDFRPWDDYFMITCVETFNPILWDLSLNVYFEGFYYNFFQYFTVTCHIQFCYDVRWHLISPRDEARLSLLIWACSFRFWQPYIFT